MNRLRTHPQREWIALFAVLFLAAGLRFWQIGDVPPGLYRDEALNGLDALEVLKGNHALFFTANNGREPLYIYLVSQSVRVFGRTTLAVRFPAALVGTLTVIPAFLLSKAWFNRRIALFTAILWAMTLWPVHLSRIGFRTILLPGTFSLALYFLTLAYRRSQAEKPFAKLALLGGAIYGLTFYTYLAVRLTPVPLILLSAYLWWLRRPKNLPYLLLFCGTGFVLAIAPLSVYLGLNADSVFGRTGQVSILHPDINAGNPVGLLIEQIGRTLGMFLWRGDTIIRHNAPARPVFDPALALPFLLGLALLLVRLRRPANAATFLLCTTMLAGTILAEDAPHFLRAAGVLPYLLIIPAIGLSHLMTWPKISPALRTGAVGLILTISTSLTIRDYFIDYSRQPDTAYLFEAAARELAESAGEALSNGTTVVMDERFPSEWASIPFLLPQQARLTTFSKDLLPDEMTPNMSIFVWPFEDNGQLLERISAESDIIITIGSKGRGDLEPEAYPLFINYDVAPQQEEEPHSAEDRTSNGVQDWINFDNQIALVAANVRSASADKTQVTLTWHADAPPATPLTAFVHIINAETGVQIGQSDIAPGGGYWSKWQRGQHIWETRTIDLTEAVGTENQIVRIGVYDPTITRLTILDKNGQPQSDVWEIDTKSYP